MAPAVAVAAALPLSVMAVREGKPMSAIQTAPLEMEKMEEAATE
jgi:hypothetical protein